MNAELHTHHIRPRLTRVLAATATAGGIATAAVTIGIATAAVTTGIEGQTPAVAQAASVRPLPLTERVLPASALPGFVVPVRPAVVRSPLSWATTVERAATPAREAKRLRQIGFVAGANEQLRGRYPLAADAVSTVEQFHSVAGARAELSDQSIGAATGPGQQVTALRTGMPGAVGWVARSPQLTAINVMFTSGSYVYLVGSAAAPGTTGAPTQHQIIADAQLVNLTVNGCVRTTSTSVSHRPAAQTGAAWPMLLH